MRTREAEALTELVLAVFRANGRLLAAGDVLVAGLGLTSSKWQMLGALALAGEPLTAPQVAMAMGVTRQGAQKQLDRLLGERLVDFRENPAHKRSPHYFLTAAGRSAYAKTEKLQARWANGLAEGFTGAQLHAAARVLRELSGKLEAAR